MVLLFESVFLELLILLAVITVGIISYYKWIFGYWKRKNLPCFQEPTIPFGNWKPILANNVGGGIFMKTCYDEIKRKGDKHTGAFALFVPHYLPIHPDLVKDILQKKFEHFSDRGFYTNERDDPLGMNIAFVGFEKWRYLRAKLSPAFSPAKTRTMFDTILKCGYQLKNALDEKHQNHQTTNFSDVSASYMVDTIGACAYGLECNSFKNPNSEFKMYGKNAVSLSSFWKLSSIGFGVGYPNAARKLGIRIFNKEITDFFINLVKESVIYRKTHNIIRKDLLQLLLELETDLKLEDFKKNSINSKNVINELAAQVFIFFVAGFETSSTTLTWCLYELASNPEIQDKLKEEVDTVLAAHSGKVSYDALMDMKYMDQVIDETLRKYPPVPFLARKCVKDYKVPDTDVTIEKGIYLFISVLGLHLDPEYFPEPEKFDPERFSEENKQKIVPFTYLPFGEGPRMCPAYRFGLMQIKVGLTVLLQNYTFTLNRKTKIPIEIDPHSFTMMPKSGIYLDLHKRSVNNN